MASAQKVNEAATGATNVPSFSAEDTMTEAARAIFAAQLAVLRQREAAVRRDADAKAIHETRKAMRRLRTAFKLFNPYFEKGYLKQFRRSFKQSMRRLGRSRDLMVFRRNLRRFTEQATRTDKERAVLVAMLPYWQEQQEEADVGARAAVAPTAIIWTARRSKHSTGYGSRSRSYATPWNSSHPS